MLFLSSWLIEWYSCSRDGLTLEKKFVNFLHHVTTFISHTDILHDTFRFVHVGLSIFRYFVFVSLTTGHQWKRKIIDRPWITNDQTYKLFTEETHTIDKRNNFFLFHDTYPWIEIPHKTITRPIHAHIWSTTTNDGRSEFANHVRIDPIVPKCRKKNNMMITFMGAENNDEDTITLVHHNVCQHVCCLRFDWSTPFD